MAWERGYSQLYVHWLCPQALPSVYVQTLSSFSLSSIEGSVTPKPPPSALCPRSDETYVVGEGEGGNVAKTPKSTKKGRRSLIPTPKGQVRGH